MTSATMTLKKLCYPLWSLALIGVLASGSAHAEKAASDELGDVLFRYTDENGSQVVRQGIPAKMAVKGYDIITKNGRVIKTVAASPSEADAAKMADKLRHKAQLERWDAHLKRRYSTPKDIVAAKKRSLAELQGNLSILQANLSGIRNQIETQQRQAGIMERNGRKVSNTILNNIKSLETQEVEQRQQIIQRQKELHNEAESFDKDIARFKKISQ